MKAYLFPGQGSQVVGMGKELYAAYPQAQTMFERANAILEFDIQTIMFDGTAEGLTRTSVTQPAIFIHSVILAAVTGAAQDAGMAAGHSLGEFSALTAMGALSFEEGLRLVAERSAAMQQACDLQPSTMAAIVGLEDEIVQKICAEIDDVVVPANYNSPGQLVISGSIAGVQKAMEAAKANNARLVKQLPVNGAFHSPLMQPAADRLAAAIAVAQIKKPVCPIYQNVDAKPTTDPAVIREKLNLQLTSAVLWTQTLQNMEKDGVTQFTELGPGKVLQGLAKRICPNIEAEARAY